MIDSAENPKKSRAVNVGAQQVAAVYAKAFLGASEKAGKTDALVSDLRTFVTVVLDPFPKLEAVFASALVSHEEKSQLLDRLFSGKLSTELLEFLKVVSRRGRLDLVRAIQQQVARLHDELRGRVRVHVRTAVAMEDAVSRRLSTALHTLVGGEPHLDAAVEPALLGGVLLRVGDTVFDGSVSWQLEQVREQMINRSIHEIQSRRDRFRH